MPEPAASPTFPPLRHLQPTRGVLHAYSRVLGSFRAALVPPHPRWWHTSLSVNDRGLTTGAVASTEEMTVSIELDLQNHAIVLDRGGDPTQIVSLDSGISPADLGSVIADRLNELQVVTEVDRARWATEAPAGYEPRVAESLHAALLGVQRVFTITAGSLTGEVGPIQLWPHHFDLSLEWFGPRMVTHGEHGEEGQTRKAPTQIGFGFSTGDDSHPEPYFYANPWPFEESFVDVELPAPARWFSEGWNGALLPYAGIVDSDGELLANYLQVVYEGTAATLS